MKLPDDYAQQIITGMMAKTLPDLCPVEVIRRADGAELLDNQIYKLADGTPVIAGQWYWYSSTEMHHVPHRENMLRIMEIAPTLEIATTNLAAYLVQYGTPPAHLQTDKQQ